MAVSMLTFVSKSPDANVNYRWPDAYAAQAGGQLEGRPGYQISSFAQGASAVLIFEWDEGGDDDSRIAAMEEWIRYAGEVSLVPEIASVGPRLGSLGGGVEGFRYSIQLHPGGLGVKTFKA